MADFVYNITAGDLLGGANALDLVNDTKLKWMLIGSASYAANRDDEIVDAGGANDPIDHELSGTGYVGGYGGSGRHAVVSPTITVVDASDYAEWDCADETWSGLDAGTIEQVLFIKEDHLGVAGNDTESRLLSHHDTNFPVVTNGGDVTIQTPNGIIRVSTV